MSEHDYFYATPRDCCDSDTCTVNVPPWGSWSLAGSTAWLCRLQRWWPALGPQERSKRPRRHDGGPETPPAGSPFPPPSRTTAWLCDPGNLKPAACHWVIRQHCLHPGDMTWKAEEKRTRRFNKTDELPINEGLNEYIYLFILKRLK